MSKKTVLAISGSHRSPSFTEKMLDLCIQGMGDEVEVHKFYPHKMKIGPCTSCWSCWVKTPGECSQKDDFRKILDVYKRADFYLLAFPLYFFGFPATVKNVIDRFFIMLEPTQYESERGTTDHPKRYDRHPKAVMISSCGFPEMENFDLVRQHFQKICAASEWPWGGEILISAAGMANAPNLFDEKYELIKKAGSLLIDGVIDKELSAKIAAPVVDAKEYRAMVSAFFSGGIKKD